MADSLNQNLINEMKEFYKEYFKNNDECKLISNNHVKRCQFVDAFIKSHNEDERDNYDFMILYPLVGDMKL